VPTLNVAGWWDQEDFYGPIRIYDALERFDTQGINYLVVGPWRHGGWSGGTGDSLGAIPVGSNTADYFRDQVQAPFFAYFLTGSGTRGPGSESVDVSDPGSRTPPTTSLSQTRRTQCRTVSARFNPLIFPAAMPAGW